MLNPQSIAFVRYFARAYPLRTVLMVFLLILSGLAEALGIAALLPVLEVAVGEGGGEDPISRSLIWLGIEPTLILLLALIVFAMTVKGALRWFAMREVGYTIARVARDLRLRLIRAIMSVRWSYFTSQPAGYFANAVSTECYRASQAYRSACNSLAGVIQVLVYAGIIVTISWEFALLALLVGGVVAGLFALFVQMGRIAGGEQTNMMKSLVGRLNDALQGIKSIKAMGREDQFFPVLEQDTRELQEAEKRQVLARESFASFQEPIIVLVIAVGLFLALEWAQMGFSSVLVLAFLFHRLTGRFHYVQGEYQGMAIGESAFWSLDSLVRRAEEEREDPGGTRAPPPLRQELRMEEVSFSYGDDPVLRGVDLSIPAGEFVALVGPSGAGKTTLVDLIVGLHRPEKGRILVDGISLAEVDLAGWREQIGYVPQETLLFHETIYNNVTLGDDTVSRDRVEAALRAAEAWTFVERLPDGVDTVIGERGSRLSGGQRQRLAIARALLGEPRLLVLDEATTALDPDTEDAICATLRRLRGEVTILSISHQSAMRGVADIVYEIRGGRVQSVDEFASGDESLKAAGASS